MTLDISTPALLFPAISLLFLSCTKRFLLKAVEDRRGRMPKPEPDSGTGR